MWDVGSCKRNGVLYDGYEIQIKSNQIYWTFIEQQRAWRLLQVAKTFNTVRIKPTSITCHRFIYSLLDAVPPIHAESSHVATDKVPSM